MSLSYNPAQLVKGAKSIFMDQLMSEPPNLVGVIATNVKSESRSEDYAWMGEATQIAEATSPELVFTPLSDTQYNIPNKKYWAGLELKKDDVSDDEVGGFEIRIREMAQVARRFPNKILTDALVNGTTLKGYDGIEFFSASHTGRGAAPSQSNLLSGAGTSAANIQTDIGKGLAALECMIGENGEPINEGFRKAFVVFPAALQAAFRTAVYGQMISQTSNVGYNNFDITLVSNPRLDATATNDWYIGVADTLTMGLIFQDREPIEFIAQDNEASDAEFVREVYRYKTRGRMAVGYGRWQRLIKINN